MEWQMNALSSCGLISRFVGNADGFALVHVLPAARVLPQAAVRFVRKDIEAGFIPDDDSLSGP